MKNLSAAEQKEVAATISALQRLRATAARKAIPWRREPPDSPGIWLAAKWQRSGFYALQRYTNEPLGYLQQQPMDFWSGPYKSNAEWLRFVSTSDLPFPTTQEP